nr:hypothetical protein [uncultured Schaedlerella sp.]
MKRHTKTEIHTEKWKYLISYINRKIKGFQKIPAVLTDRACKISALSFFALLLGVHTGRQAGSPGLILWSVLICLFGMLHAYHLLRCGERQDYEIVEGVVYELQGRHSPGRVYQVGIRLGDGQAVQLLMDKQYRFRIGGRYRFYFNPKRQNVFFGIKGLDVALNTGSFYGVEELE